MLEGFKQIINRTNKMIISKSGVTSTNLKLCVKLILLEIKSKAQKVEAGIYTLETLFI